MLDEVNTLAATDATDATDADATDAVAVAVAVPGRRSMMLWLPLAPMPMPPLFTILCDAT